MSDISTYSAWKIFINKYSFILVGVSFFNIKILFSQTYTRPSGKKFYEMKDHLGNVNAVVSDKKNPVNVNDLAAGATASVESYTNYYAYGMEQPGRNFSSPDYRYGYNGKEKDNELKGEGNSYDYGARIYDPREGRWLSLDPLQKKYPEYSPYNYVLGNPIKNLDPDGSIVKDANGNIIFTVTNPKFEIVQGVRYAGTAKFTTFFYAKQGKILTDGGTEVVADVVTSRAMVRIEDGGKSEVMEIPANMGDFETRFNCVGNSLANQQLVIPISEITDKYLVEEGIRRLLPVEIPQKGDVGLYTDVVTGKADHMELFISPQKVNSKDGILPVPSPSLPGTYNTFVHNKNPTRYGVLRKDNPDVQVVSPQKVPIPGPVGRKLPNQVEAKVPDRSTKNGVNEVNSKEFENVKKAVIDRSKK